MRRTRLITAIAIAAAFVGAPAAAQAGGPDVDRTVKCVNVFVYNLSNGEANHLGYGC